MGIVLVAFFAANGVGPPEVTIRSTLRRTNSAASSGRRSDFCSANRYSMVIFFPSIQPSLLNSCRNASKSPAIPDAVLGSRNPIRGTFVCCCASTEPQNAKSMAQSAKLPSFRLFISPSRLTHDCACFVPEPGQNCSGFRPPLTRRFRLGRFLKLLHFYYKCVGVV